MKINGISLGLESRINPSRNNKESAIQNTKKDFSYSSLEILGLYNKISFERNYGKNISTASVGIEKAIANNDFNKALKILKSFYGQNKGRGKFFDNIEENMQTTVINSGGKKYSHKYSTGDDSDLLLNKNHLAYRKGTDVIEFNLLTNSERTYKEQNFAAYDLIKNVKMNFFLGENDVCADLAEDFYKKYKNSKLQNKTTVSDDGILVMSKDKNGKGKIEILFVSEDELLDKNNEEKQGIILETNKKGEMLSYSTVDSCPDGFRCMRTYVYNFN